MTTANTGGPAFPCFHGMVEQGMTLRDYFAAKAMQAYCSDPDYRQDCDPEDTAIAAYTMADEMLIARGA